MATRRLLVEIVGDDQSLQRTLRSSAAASEGFGRKLVGVGMDMVKTFAPIVATFAAADFAKGAIEGAEHLKLAQESLAVAIDHTGGNVDKLMGRYTATAKAAAQFGINQTDATRGLAKATLLTGSAAKAQRAYQEAVLISKATGKDLNAVLIATSKGQNGVTSSLARYGIKLKEGASGTDQFTQIMQRFGGQAAANTSATDKLRANFENLQTSLGTLLLPTFNKIVEAINSVVTWLQSPAVSQALHRFVDTIKTELQPVVAWVREHWSQIRAVIETVGRAIIADVKIAWAFVKATIQNAMEVIRGIIDVIGGLIHGDWGRVWHGIKEIVGGILKEIWALIRAAVSHVGGAARAVGHAIWAGITSGLDSIKNAFTSLFNWIVGKLDWLLNKIRAVTSKIPGAGGGGGGFSIPTPIPGVNIPIPHAMGGPVAPGVSYLVGERGAELFVPSQAGMIVPNNRLGGIGVRGGDVYHVEVNVPHWIGSKRDLEDAIVTGLSQWARRNGNAQMRAALGVGI